MTKQELVDRVAAKIARTEELPKKTVALVMDAMFAELGEYFVKARVTSKSTPRFTYPGFGTFTKKERSARAGRNPRSGETIEIPALTTVGFQPGQDLRAELNRVSSSPRLGPKAAHVASKKVSHG